MPLTKKERLERTRTAILSAARRQFARQGFNRTTIRSVATEADIDPSMVMRYYGNKRDLFRAATDLDLDLPDLAAVAPSERGHVVIQHFLDLWEDSAAEDPLRMLLASAVDDPVAAARVGEIIDHGLGRIIASAVDEPPATARARTGLVASALLGLALCRYVVRLPAVAELAPEVIVASMGPALTSALRDDLSAARAAPAGPSADGAPAVR